ncbi:hypothetical protein GGR52DRAFT_575356 [Hypoxylon sp. FL1284]|nr:hypothetical protein GGR52DRAFT_575356 [Hypoxylon sp. FL1284]
MCPLFLLAVGLRLYSRKLANAGIGWDDGLILIATMLVIALLGLSIAVQNRPVRCNDQTNILWLLLVFNILYLFSVCLTKLSALCLYIRIFTLKKRFKLACKILGIIIAILYVAVLVQEVTVSGIAIQLWNKQHLGNLTDKKRVDIGTAFYSMLGNIVILVLPLFPIWKLQMSRQKKISLTILFLSGLCVTVVASFRLMGIVAADYENALIAVTSRIMSLQVLEPELAIFTLCLPVLHRFWLESWSRCFGPRKQPRRPYEMGSMNPGSIKVGDDDQPVRWDEFIRWGYSVSVEAGAPRLSTPDLSRPHGPRQAQDPDGNPGQINPIVVDTTWSVSYEAAESQL